MFSKRDRPLGTQSCETREGGGSLLEGHIDSWIKRTFWDKIISVKMAFFNNLP